MQIVFFVVIMAIAQGVAEFLPISSSGHLLVLGNWFGFDGESNMFLNVVLHAGTLLAILVFYFKKLLSILLEPERRRLIGLVIAGSIPAAIVGVSLKAFKLDEVIFSEPLVSGIGFAVTATMLLVVFGKPWKKQSEEDAANAVPAEKMSYKQALLIGLAQAIAITPGISRSGSTISMGVLSKLRKADAAEFSFLLAIPAIGGAALLEFIDVFKNSSVDCSGSMIAVYLLGFVLSAVVGYAALAGLIAMLRRGKLGWFAIYLYIASAVVVAVELCKNF